MPLFYQHVNEFAKIAIWHIEEEKKFFSDKVPLQREITHPHKQLQHLAGRYLLQYLYPDFPYHLIEIADTRKPFLPNEEYHFSISHCGDYAAVIISKDRRVGIDAELVSHRVEKIKHKFLDQKELENIQYAIFNIQYSIGTHQLLTLLWSCKETVFKWYGYGEIDFRKHIQLVGKNENEKIIECDFLKNEKVRLQIRYEFFGELCMAWVMS